MVHLIYFLSIVILFHQTGLKSYNFIAWEPTEVEVEILRQNPKRRKVENKSTIGKNICSSNIFIVTFHLIIENKSDNIACL